MIPNTNSNAPSAALPPLERDASRTRAPLSRMQARLVFIQELNPGKPLYQIPTAFRIFGPIDAALLERCLGELVLRHHVLRSKVAFENDVAISVIDDSIHIPLERLDFSNLPPDERDQAVKQALGAIANTPMNLHTGPLIRFVLATKSPDESVFFLMPHHIVWDGASHDIFLKELDALYHAYSEGKPSPLRAPKIQYTDFAAWHEAWLQGAALTEDLHFWKEKLKGDLPPINLPTDRSRPAHMSFSGNTAYWTLGNDEVNALTELGRASGATLYMVLMAAYATWLFRLTHQDDIRIGTPVRGRLWSRTQSVVGFFVNTVILRLSVNSNISFSDLLLHVRDTAREAFAHQETPLDVLVRELNVPRDTSRAPVSQTFFAFRDVRDVPEKLLGVPAQEIPMYADFETQDITLWATQAPHGINGALTYNTDLFDRSTIDRMLAEWRVLLANLPANAERRIDELQILPETESAQLLKWNDTFNVSRQDRLIHELFMLVAEHSAASIAVVTKMKSLTYEELDAASNRLARYLQSRGVTPNTPVGLCLERSTDLLVGLLAILKAGAAYVPVDPAYPAERISHMVTDSEMRFVLTDEQSREALPSSNVEVVIVDRIREALAATSAGALTNVNVTRNSMAYIIYTSGSTGKPKGVVVPHGAVTNLISSTQKVPGMTSSDVVLAVTTLSFDIAVYEVLTSLCSGSKVVLAEREMAADGERLKQAMIDHRVTILNATPATWRLLIAAGWRGTEGLTAICTGEAMPRDLAEALVNRCHRVWNGYGPTETTVWSTFWQVQPSFERILIGRPIDRTRLYIVDASKNLVPIGVSGELWIGGDGVTLGYWKQPSLTSDRFIDDPFSSDPQARVYKTGDLARYLPSGDVECLGRNDSQVKLRGFRIELGEIEAALTTFAAIAQAVVILRDHPSGEPSLAAYFSLNPGHNATATQLRSHLRKSLPQFMIPQHFVEMQTFPLTPSGKIDRKRLPFAGATQIHHDDFVPPQTDSEKYLARLWAQLLGVDRVSATDNFFNIGGHSMLSLQLIATIERETGHKVSPRVFLVNSLAQIAATLTPPKSASNDDVGAREAVSAPAAERKSLQSRIFSRIKRALE